MTRMGILLGGIVFSVAAGAHHSTNLYFDRGDVIEIAGTLTQVEWRNPHTLLIVETPEEDGQREESTEEGEVPEAPQGGARVADPGHPGDPGGEHARELTRDPGCIPGGRTDSDRGLSRPK